MIVSILILLFSLILFAYWFRYTCLLILKAAPATDYAEPVAEANQLSFLTVQKKLVTGEAGELDGLHELLQRDYRFLSYLMRHASDFGGLDLEHMMLMADYKIMSGWYAVSRSRQALEEMSSIVGHFAHAVGERAEASASV
ncbi:MAG TPA: hypothetical protein DEH78_09235 [Solibacterales bacterium]|nr:hypothetical protein [Bryobacterales bacterium]